jgi:hypothetical protein
LHISFGTPSVTSHSHSQMAPSSTQCTGLTQKGLQCKRRVAFDTDTDGLCYQHFRKACKEEVAPEPPQSDCPICYEKKELVKTPCNHEFCKECLDRWQLSSNQCPLCRTHLPQPQTRWPLTRSQTQRSEMLANALARAPNVLMTVLSLMSTSQRSAYLTSHSELLPIVSDQILREHIQHLAYQ